MKILDVAARSWRNLRASKVRTILTALAIAVGGFTLTITLAAGNGMRDYTDKLVANNFDPAELLVGRDKEVSNTGLPSTEVKEYDESVTSWEAAGGGGGSIQLKRVTQEDINEIKSLDYVESVRESYSLDVRYVTREGQKKYATGAEAYNPSQKPEVASGSLPNSGDIAKGKALLPESFVGPLGFSSPQDAIGKTIELNVSRTPGQQELQQLLQSIQSGGSLDPSKITAQQPEQKTYTFEIAATTKRPATSFAVGQIPIYLSSEDSQVIYQFTAQGTDDYQKYLYAYVRIDSGQNEAKLAEAKSDLESRGYYVITSKEIQKAITQFVDILQILVGVFGFITVVASIFGIVNTQYISVIERTREIGLMKALGMRSQDVRRLFTFEATWIGFLGGVIGSLTGFIAGTLLNPWLTEQLDLGEGNNLFIFDPLQIIGLVVFLILVGAVAGLLPAIKAAKMNPIDALRSE